MRNSRIGFFIRYFIFAYLYLIYFCPTAFSQKPKIESITVADGLPQGFVPTILEDRDGFMWFGTMNGLCRYDGYNFIEYSNNLQDSTSIIDNRIYSIAEDSLGRIWVATFYNGIDCFDPKTEVFHHIGFDFSDQPNLNGTDQNISKTKNGDIWVESNTGLYQIVGANSRKIEDITFEDYITGNEFPVVQGGNLPKILSKNEVFLVNDKKLLLQESREKSFVELPLHVANYLGHTLILRDLGNDPNTWIFNNGILWCYNAGKLIKTIKLKNVPDRESPYNANDFIYEDKFGNLWILFFNQLFKIEAEELESKTVELRQIISDPICITMYKDRSNKLWIGTNGYGIRVLDTEKPIVENLFVKLSPNSIEHYQGDYLLLSNFYVVDLKDEVIVDYSTKERIGNDNTTYSIVSDTKLEVVENGERKYLMLKSTRDKLFFIDKQERLWVFIDDCNIGVKERGGDSFTYFSYTHLWEKDIFLEVVSINESIDGSLWVSTSNGLIQMSLEKSTDSMTFKLWNVGKHTELVTNNILCSLDDPTDPENHIWIGTNGEGLTRMDKRDGSCIHFNKEDGLPNNVVYGILPDDKSNLWLSTNFGLSRFNYKNRYFKNFTCKEDGLQADEFNSNAFLKLDDGRLVFGGVGGVSIINPEDFKSNIDFGKVFFAKLKINNKEIKYKRDSIILEKPLRYSESLNLDYDQNFISVNYARLPSENLGSTNYFYKMEGVNKDWVFAGNKTELTYPNLSPGSYTLKIADINDNGQRNPNPSSLKIYIASPWWASTFAYIIYFLIAMATVIWIFKNRLSKVTMKQELLYTEKEVTRMKEIDDLKSRVFSNITHEFRTPLTLIIEPARQVLTGLAANPKKQASIIYNNANRLLLMVNQLLDVSKLEEHKMQLTPAYGDILIIVKEIFSYFESVAEAKDITLSLETNVKELSVNFDKNAAEKILYNLLSNAIKFTDHGGKVCLIVESVDAEWWRIKVNDNGNGIENSKLSMIYDRFYQTDDASTRKAEGSGIGLSLVKELVNLVEGKIDVKSNLGEGTEFTLLLPKFLQNDTKVEFESVTSNNLIETVLNPVYQSGVLDQNSESLDAQDSQKILVVEDNSDLSEFLGSLLENEGFAVRYAENGEIGLKLAKEEIPDLIISDIMMPVMDGFQMLDAIKKDIVTSHIPIIILTAKTRQVTKVQGYQKGAHAYLPKPFNSEELLVRLKQILGARKILQEKIQIDLENKTLPADNVAVQKPEKEGSGGEIMLSKIDEKWLAELKALVYEKLTSGPFNVEDLATKMYMSRTQFFAKTKAITGLTPGVLVKNARLEMAYSILTEDPEISFAEVADSLGILDAKYFKRVFVKKFGIKPEEVINKA